MPGLGSKRQRVAQQRHHSEVNLYEKAAALQRCPSDTRGDWLSGDEITFDITGLNPGKHTILFTVNDGLGGIVSDTVIVTVEESSSNEGGSDSNKKGSDSILWLFIVLGVVATAGIGGGILVSKRKSNSARAVYDEFENLSSNTHKTEKTVKKTTKKKKSNISSDQEYVFEWPDEDDF